MEAALHMELSMVARKGGADEVPPLYLKARPSVVVIHM